MKDTNKVIVEYIKKERVAKEKRIIRFPDIKTAQSWINDLISFDKEATFTSFNIREQGELHA